MTILRDKKGASPRAENAPQEVGMERAEIVCVDRLGITHTPSNRSIFASNRALDINKQLTGRKIHPLGIDAAHSWKETAVKTFLKYFSVAHS
jgi:hypothetical protein